MAFNPDKYLADNAPAVANKPKSGGFDPDAYLDKAAKQTTSPYSDEGNAIKQSLLTAGKAGLGALNTVARTIDRFTGAPTRAAIGAAQNADTPLDIVPDAVAAGAHQFGRDPDQAPTGEDIVKRAGVPQGAASKVLGFGMDMAANPLNFAGPVASAVNKLGVADAVGNSAVNGFAKVSHAFTGMPEADIATYARNMPQVNKIIEAADVGDKERSLTNLADNFRGDLQGNLRSTRSGLSGQIGEALKSAPPDKVHNIQLVIDEMEAVKSTIRPELQPELRSDIDQMIGRIKAVAPDGKASIQDLQDAKNFLQDLGKKSYLKDGEIFQNPEQTARAAKQGARGAKEILDTKGPEAIKNANAKLTELHDIEDEINPNLITPGAPDSALFAAASGANPRNQQNLAKLSELAGTPDAMQEVQKLSAARSFMNPPIMPVDTTGKSAARMGLGYGLGRAAGTFLGGHMGGEIGGIAGAAITSPFALKQAMNAGQGIANIANSPWLKAIRENPALLNGISDPSLRNVLGNMLKGEGSAVPAFASGKDDAKGDEQSSIRPDILEKYKANPSLIDNLSNPDLKENLKKAIDRSPTSQSYVPHPQATQQYLESN